MCTSCFQMMRIPLYSSRTPNLLLISLSAYFFGLLFLSALQKEQVSYLYQLNQSFTGAQLLIIHNFVLTELEKWVHLMQIVSSMNPHALIGATENSGKSLQGSLNQNRCNKDKSITKHVSTVVSLTKNSNPTINLLLFFLFFSRLEICTSQSFSF